MNWPAGMKTRIVNPEVMCGAKEKVMIRQGHWEGSSCLRRFLCYVEGVTAIRAGKSLTQPALLCSKLISFTPPEPAKMIPYTDQMEDSTAAPESPRVENAAACRKTPSLGSPGTNHSLVHESLVRASVLEPVYSESSISSQLSSPV